MLGQLKSLFKDSSVYGLGEFLNKGIQVLFLPLIFAYLPTEDYGVLEYFLTFKNIISVALGWGIMTSIQRFGNNDQEVSLSSVVSSSLLTMVIIDTVLSFFLSIGAYFLIDNILGEGLFVASILTIITSYFFALRSIPLGVLRLKREPSKYLIVSFLNVVIYLIATFVLVVFYNLTYMAFLYGGAIGILCSTLFGYIYIYNLISFKLDLELTRKVYVFGASVLTTSLCYTLLNSTSRLFLKYNGSFTDVAIVGMSNKLALFVGAIIVAPFSLAWLPFVNEISKQDNFQDILKKVQILYTIISSILILIISLFSREILLLANDQEYLLASYYVPFFSIAYLLQGLYFIYSSGIYLSKKSKYYLYLAITTATANIILYILLIDILDVFLASIITMVSFLLQLILAKYYSKSIIKIKLFNKDMIIVLSSMSIVIYIGILYVNTFSLLNGIILKVILIISFLVLIGLVTSAKSDIQLMSNIVKRKFS